jgi:hypothetical protein
VAPAIVWLGGLETDGPGPGATGPDVDLPVGLLRKYLPLRSFQVDRMARGNRASSDGLQPLQIRSRAKGQSQTLRQVNRRATEEQVLEDAERLVVAWNERQAKRIRLTPMLATLKRISGRISSRQRHARERERRNSAFQAAVEEVIESCRLPYRASMSLRCRLQSL